MDTLVASKIEELEDYTELAGLIDPAMVPDPELSKVFVHRGADGKIDGYCMTQAIVVVEPIWVAEHMRRRGVAARLFGAVVESLKKVGLPAFYCRAETDEVEGYLKRVGMKPAGKAFVLRLGGG